MIRKKAVCKSTGKGQPKKRIVTVSWNMNREIKCFVEQKNGALKLLPHSYESTGEFAMLNPGRYEFIPFHLWMEYNSEQVKL